MTHTKLYGICFLAGCIITWIDNLYSGLARYLKYQNLGSIMAKGCGSAETVKNSLYAKNYIDWDAYFVQAKDCYEVIRKHGRQVIIMEPVKGGMLAKVPEEAAKLMEAGNPEASAASWAIRYAAGLDGVLAVLSGMSTLDQVRNNVSFMNEFQPLSEQEKDILKQTACIYRESGPAGTADFTKYEKVNPKGISAAAILDCYNSCMLQPVPTFGAEHNYFSSEKAKHGLHKEDLCIPGEVILEDGTDATELVHKAEAFLNESAFFQYEC